MRCGALLAVLVASGWAGAADDNGAYAVLGSASCARFIEDRKEGRWQAVPHAAWVEGYVTAYNAHVPDTYNLLGATEVEPLLERLENWCSVNPDKALVDGLRPLLDALYPARQRRAPAGGK